MQHPSTRTRHTGHVRHSTVGALGCCAALFALHSGAFVSSAAVIGSNSSAQAITEARVAALPASEQAAWKEYLERSQRQRRVDQAFLQQELRAHGLKQLTVPPPRGRGQRGLPFHEPAGWYGGSEAIRIARVVISFQTPSGGWSKNLNLQGNPRAPGMHFAPDNSSRRLGPDDFEEPLDRGWNYVGTLDNGATITELRYLAKVAAAAGSTNAEPCRSAFLRGIEYILAAQYPNGGWPQVWPIQGGYHDAITFNDGAYVNVLSFLREVALGTNEFAFVPGPVRARAAAGVERGVNCVLASQIAVAGRRTIWAQQHDALTLQPASARNYEMPSQAPAESAGVLLFLMRLPDPEPEVIAAIESAAAWFEKTKIPDVAFQRVGDTGRHLVAAPGKGPLWGRYHEIGTDRPVFGDRDKTIHDTVDEISKERRDGYSWYVDTPQRALEQYAAWKAARAAARPK